MGEHRVALYRLGLDDNEEADYAVCLLLCMVLGQAVLLFSQWLGLFIVHGSLYRLGHQPH